MSDDLLRLSGVVAGYGGGDVLQGVEIGVPRGSVACIVGPNGAGKSTVLKTISGLLDAEAWRDPPRWRAHRQPFGRPHPGPRHLPGAAVRRALPAT